MHEVVRSRPIHGDTRPHAGRCDPRITGVGWVARITLPEGHPFRAVAAQPEGPTSPEIWILGSSDYGAQLAAHFGLPYAFAYFFSDGQGVDEALALYRKNFRPGARHSKPTATICVWALAADTETEARRLATTRE
jgi:alkanesulfonate monooxygenase SsuD/methylene tetrahydromethanopterin reductase-like flavin-dependent oxidoreductase (luciferase family)